MNKKIEKYIALAMPILESEQLHAEYKGYLASFGPALNQSGLIPTIIFYSAVEHGAQANRQRIVDWIFQILGESNDYPTNQFADLKELALSFYQSPQELRILRQHVENISIALKLCIRTFSLKEENVAQ